MRFPFSLFLFLSLYIGSLAQSTAPSAALDLPDAPTPSSEVLVQSNAVELAVVNAPEQPVSSSSFTLYPDGYQPLQGSQADAKAAKQSDRAPVPIELDANGNPIPLNRRQPKRILGFMPNFRSVSNGATPPPPTWKNNFKVATRQSFDYSSFIFLGITSLTAEGIDSHPVLGKGIGGFYAYTWRGFLDKTDGTYLGAWLLPSLLHEDTRFYALGNGHSIPIRALYVISRQGVARTYGGRQTPNIAGLGAKVLTQVVSRTYYPTGATSFSVLATKFAYSAMRDIAFTSIREFYPDIAAHYVRKHREKLLRQQQLQLQQP